MCLSKVYVDSNGSRELLMEQVASADIHDGKLLLKTLFGEQKEIAAKIRQIDFMTHRMIVVSQD